MKIRQTRVIRSIALFPTVFGFVVGEVAIFLSMLLMAAITINKNLLLGIFVFFLLSGITYLYIKGYLDQKKILYQKYRYLVLNKYIKVNKNNK